MPDMLCSLVQLPDVDPLLEKLRKEGITIRRPHPWEKSKLRDFILAHFQAGWAEESEVAFHHQPVSAFIALKDDQIIGFSAYECTRKNFFGPTGVDESARGLGVGKALFIAALMGLQDLGYAYCIIGGAGPVDFYLKCSESMVITLREGRGIYDLKEDQKFQPPLKGS